MKNNVTKLILFIILLLFSFEIFATNAGNSSIISKSSREERIEDRFKAISAMCLFGVMSEFFIQNNTTNLPSIDLLKHNGKQFSETMGASFKLKGSTLEVYIDKIKALAAEDSLLKAEKTDNKFSNNLDASVLALPASLFILNYIYENTDANQLNVKAYLTTIDDINTTKREVFSFEFSRNLYNKIDWDIWNVANTTKNHIDSDIENNKIITENLNFSEWFLQQVISMENESNKNYFNNYSKKLLGSITTHANNIYCEGMTRDGIRIHVIDDKEAETLNVNGNIYKITQYLTDKEMIFLDTERFTNKNKKYVYVSFGFKLNHISIGYLMQIDGHKNTLLSFFTLSCHIENRE